ncbi:hypothetical protein [Kalamiella sp. sgz302252]|uniref:hypothetical protein n=1 Tax=Pantoea sp. sgz302252 TaxID=3341827 RepID=UPI0036D3276B
MKTIAIATLLGLVLSTPALASDAGCAQQVKSLTSKAANSYVYINRIDTPASQPTDNPSVTAPATRRLVQQL